MSNNNKNKSSSSKEDCGSLWKTFSECVQRQNCSVQLKDYFRCEQQSLRLRWQKDKPTDPNNKKRRITFKHYDNFGTIVNEPIELRRRRDGQDKSHTSEQSKKPPIAATTTSRLRKGGGGGVDNHQQRWGTYEPMSEGLPLVEFWKSYWKHSRRLLGVMLDGKFLQKTEQFGRKMYRHMEKEWGYLHELWKTWTNSSWRKRPN